jgi:hypothetical protein
MVVRGERAASGTLLSREGISGVACLTSYWPIQMQSTLIYANTLSTA